MLMTPDEPPEARRGCPSKVGKINKPIKISTNYQMTLTLEEERQFEFNYAIYNISRSYRC